jgi:hypothetical protein
MAQRRSKVSIPGVAEGKKLVGVPTDDGLTAEDKVMAFVAGTLSGTEYQVSALFPWPPVTLIFSISNFPAAGMGLRVLPVRPSPTHLGLCAPPRPDSLRLHGRTITLQPTGQLARGMHRYPLRHVHLCYLGPDCQTRLLGLCRCHQDTERYISATGGAG